MTKTPVPVKDTLGRPLRDLRISITDRCNFRCTYCMPAEIFGERYQFLNRSQLLTFEEIVRIAGVVAKLGAIKVRLTGGEPLVRSQVVDLVRMLSQLDGVQDLTMTTNGYLLPKHAEALKQAGLRRATVSLDTLDDAVFRKMNGRNFGVDSVLAGIEAAQAADLTPVKINSVVQRGVNDHTVVELARRFKGSGHILRFIEFMDVGTLNGWKMAAVVPAAEIVAMIDAEMPLEQVPASYPGEVASRYRYTDGSGEIGVISSVTKPFCGDCTRLRLSPEGELYTCLFGSEGTDLRAPLRDGVTDDDLEQIVRQVWVGRGDRYSAERTALTKPRPDKVEMYHIGG